jgi:hypothetical protein
LHSKLPGGSFQPRRTGSNLFLHGQSALFLFRIRQRVTQLLGFVSKSQGREVLHARVNEPSGQDQRRDQQ